MKRVHTLTVEQLRSDPKAALPPAEEYRVTENGRVVLVMLRQAKALR